MEGETGEQAMFFHLLRAGANQIWDSEKQGYPPTFAFVTGIAHHQQEIDLAPLFLYFNLVKEM